jgi:Kef-type K+ transport system membrane component KefB
VEPFARLLIVVGGLLVIDLLAVSGLRRVGVPGVVVHLGLGVALAFAEAHFGLLGANGRDAVSFLGSIGIVCLLFRAGLESNVRKLLQNLRRASLVWLADVAVSGALGFAASRYALGLPLLPSLFVAVAMTATSVGVGVAVWRDQGALDSRPGQLLLDVAELDDISGIVLMAVLFSLAPLLQAGAPDGIAAAVGTTTGGVLLRLCAFAAACALFARFLEQPLTRLLGRVESVSDRLISVAGVGLVVAALAGLLGFSLAIGAFFAGLAFSRDPRAVKLDASFDVLSDFFTPFFFVSIGLGMDPDALAGALSLGGALLVVAAAGKLLGAGGGAFFALGGRSAGLIGVSMIPRAEIAMVVMQQGRHLGEAAVPAAVFSAMVLVSAATCLLAPLAIQLQLRRRRA